MKPKPPQCPVCGGTGKMPLYDKQPGLRGEWTVVGYGPCQRCNPPKDNQPMRPVNSEWVEEWTP